MAKTYILIEANGTATMIPERDIERVAAEHMVSGKTFQIFRAEPMRLQISLAPASGAAPVAIPRAAAKKGRRKKAAARKGRRKKASKKKAAAKKTTARRGKGTGRVGRPPVNIGPCTVAGCKKPSKTRGLCSAHYQQHRRLVREKKPGLISKRASPASAAPAGKKVTARRASASRRKSARRTTKKTAPQAAKQA